MTTATQARYKQLRDHLLHRIRLGEFPVSSALPPISETSREAGVSYVTAQRAYRLLADEGVLDVSPGRGRRSVVLRRSPLSLKSPLVIGGLFRPFHQRNAVDNYALDMYESACRRMVRHRASLIPRKISEPGDAESLLEDIREQRVQGVLLDEVTPDEVVGDVAASGCPAALYGRHAPRVPIDSVSPDYELSGRITAQMILEGGYDRVVFWHDVPPGYYTSPSAKTRLYALDTYRDAILAKLAEGGMRRSRIQEAPLGLTKEDEAKWFDPSHTAGVLRRLGVGRGSSMAFVTMGDKWGLHALEALRANGLTVPGQCGVIGRGGQQINRYAEDPVTSWRIDPIEIGRVAAETLLERIEFPQRDRVRRYLRPDLVDHGTL